MFRKAEMVLTQLLVFATQWTPPGARLLILQMAPLDDCIPKCYDGAREHFIDAFP
jgi:hypothetical protein